MFNKRLLGSGFLIATILMSLTAILTPTQSWVYQDGTPEDTKFEKFGPRADRLLLKLNSTGETLENGEVDISDLSVNASWYETLTKPPYNETINVVRYGPEYAFYMLDINNANTTTSPVYPNPLSVLSFRQAIAHLVDRAWLVNVIGPLWFIPIWVPMSPAMGKYYLNIPNPYPYSRIEAENLLDLDGFPVNSTTGYRFWDRNGNGVEEPEEFLELRFVIRSDHAHRRIVGDKIADELDAVSVRVNRIYVDRTGAYIIVNVNRDFHLYTGSYDVGPDPRYLYDCFHSSQIPQANYNGINDTGLDYWLEMLINAATQEEAVVASHNSQQVFVNESFKVPLWVYCGYKAMYRRYTGGTAGNPVTPDDGENIYRNITWQGAVNIPECGIDNYFSFLNMHPTGFAYGHNDNMTIRYGIRPTQISQLNPIYASWPNDWIVLNLIYEGLIKSDPYKITDWMPWIAKNFTVGTYIHPALGNCTKVTITMRTDVTWQDGTPVTTADAEFTLVDLDDVLEDLGYPPPWWYANVRYILDFKIFDPYNFEILFDRKLYWAEALSMIAGTPLLPRHIWLPIVQTGDPTGFAPDPNMISCGPWRLKEYVPDSHVLLVANEANSTVQTNLPGSYPVNSPYGFFQFYPIYADIHFKPPYEYRHRIPPEPKSVEYKVTLENLIREQITIENTTNVNLTDPVGSEWHETWPTKSLQYWFMEWVDNGDTVLSPSDVIGIAPIWPPIEWYHVENMRWLPDPIGPEEGGVWALELKPVVIVNKYLYIDGFGELPIEVILKPEIPHEQQRILWPSVGRHTIKVEAHIKQPDWNSWKLYDKWVNYTFTFWVTIPEDIGGTFYLGMVAPDIRVEGKDIAIVSKAFGTKPGDPRWSPYADITCDYRVEGKDMARVARMYGWRP